MPCFIEVKMAANNSIVADAVLEDKLADLWPDYPCLYIISVRRALLAGKSELGKIVPKVLSTGILNRVYSFSQYGPT